MSQKQLAEKVGTTQSQINKLETGEVTRPRNIPEIAKGLGVSQAWLVFGTRETDKLSPDSMSVAVAYEALPLEARAEIHDILARYK